MRRTLLISLLVIFSISLGLLIQMDPGYLLISYQSATYETTLWFAFLSLAAVAIVLTILLKLIRRVISSPARVKRWMNYRQQKQADSCTHLAIESFIQQDWRSAVNHAKNAAKSSKKPEQMQLFSALCASMADHHEDARELLLNHGQINLSQRIVDASLLINEDKLDLAKLQLQQLQQEKPYHAGIARLLLQTYKKQAAWQAMLDLALIARKHQLLEPQEQTKFETSALWHLFSRTEHYEDIEKLWVKTSRELKKDSIVISAYLEALGRKEQWSILSKKVKKLIINPHDKLMMKAALPLCHNDSKNTMKWLCNLERKHDSSAHIHWLKAECLSAENLTAMASEEVKKGLQSDPSHQDLIKLQDSI